ncbi:MAG: ABC transporter permease [Trueperaceae bacterium]|nr:ABC transporter permease [Trueperaceae bacterium]
MTALLWRKIWRKPGFVFGVAVLVPLALAAIFANYVAPYAPNDMLNQRYVPPFSPGHVLGTDNLGRDILSRLVYGARLSLVVGFLAIGIALTAGTVLGVVAGYAKGAVDNVIMRIMDVLLAFPDILLALMMITMLGPGLQNVMIALGVASIPGYTRLARGATLEVAAFDYVEASRSLGTSRVRILFRHVVPNMIQPVLVVATLGVAGAILAAAGLSFIGLGAPPGTPEWGAMLSDARTYMRRAWWIATIPGIAISLTVLAISLMGEALRDVLDPKLK